MFLLAARFALCDDFRMPHTHARELTDRQVGTYLVFRMKLNELMHLHYLIYHLLDGGCGNAIDGVDPGDMANTVRTCAMAWFCTFLDRNGLNIFDLWKKMFPQYARRLALYRALLERDLVRLRAFRNRSAFHAEPYFRKFLEPRVEMQEHSKEDVEALRRFFKLAIFLLNREHTVDPNLQSRILGVVLDTELALNCRIRRRWLVDTNILDRSSVFGTWRF